MIKVVPSNTTSKYVNAIMPILSKILTVLKYKCVYYYSIISIIIGTLVSIALAVFLTMKPTKELWFGYGPLLAMIISLSNQLLFSLINFQRWNKIKFFFDTKLPWDFTCLPNELKDTLQKIGKRSDLLCIAVIVIVEVCTLVNQIQLFPVLLNLYTGILQDSAFKKVVVLHIALTGQFTVGFLVWPGFSTVYLSTIVRLQLEVLLFTLREFQAKTPQKNETQHQTHVLKGLRQLAKSYKYIMEIISKLKQWAFWSNIFLGLNIIFLLGFYSLIMFSPYYDYKLTIVSYLCTVILVFYFCYEGQIFENSLLEVSNELYNLEWYRWDKSSTDLFKALFTSACIPFKMNNNCILQVNHECFKQCMVMAYSLFNLVEATAFK